MPWARMRFGSRAFTGGRSANTMFGPCVAEFETSLPAGRAGEGSEVVSGSFSNFKTCAHVGQADMGGELKVNLETR
jgi:hypothetical protein